MGVYLTYRIKLKLNKCTVIWIHALDVAMTGKEPWPGTWPKQLTAKAASHLSSAV